MEIVPSSGVLQVEARICRRTSTRDGWARQPPPARGIQPKHHAPNRWIHPQAVGGSRNGPGNGASFDRAAISIPKEKDGLLPQGLALLPGMPVDVFITTGDCSMLSYVSKPILDRSNRLFREE